MNKNLESYKVTKFTLPEIFSMVMQDFCKCNLQKSLLLEAPGESAIRMVNLVLCPIISGGLG